MKSIFKKAILIYTLFILVLFIFLFIFFKIQKTKNNHNNILQTDVKFDHPKIKYSYYPTLTKVKYSPNSINKPENSTYSNIAYIYNDGIFPKTLKIGKNIVTINNIEIKYFSDEEKPRMDETYVLVNLAYKHFEYVANSTFHQSRDEQTFNLSARKYKTEKYYVNENLLSESLFYSNEWSCSDPDHVDCTCSGTMSPKIGAIDIDKDDIEWNFIEIGSLYRESVSCMGVD